MKKIFLSLFLAVALKSYSQNTLTVNNMLPTDISVFNQINSKNSSRALKYDEIKGTPFLNSSFIMAKFGDNYETAPARYNSYTDEIEYQKNGQIYLLPKDTGIQKIVFTNNKDVLVNLKTDDELSGYFFELVNGRYSLYKKVKTKFIDSVAPRNSYDTEKPAEFRTFDPVYYIKTEKGFIKKPKNQKSIIEEIPEKKDALTAFFKENKIKLDNENDLKKLVDFLNQ